MEKDSDSTVCGPAHHPITCDIDHAAPVFALGLCKFHYRRCTDATRRF